MKWWLLKISSIATNIPVLILNVVRLSVKDCVSFFLLFINCMEITWIRESSFNVEKSNVKRGGGLTFCVCLRGTNTLRFSCQIFFHS